VRYAGRPQTFEQRQDQLNQVLVHAGLRLSDDGRLERVARARTLSDGAQLTGRLGAELTRRSTHAEVLRYCQEELIHQDLFHAVFEATRGLAEAGRVLECLPVPAAPSCGPRWWAPPMRAG